MLAFVLQPQHEALHPTVADGQVSAQVVDQAAKWKQQRRVMLDLIAQLDAVIEMIGRCVERERIVGISVQTIQVFEQFHSETPAQAVAWQAAQGAKIAHAHAVQTFAYPFRQSGASDRHLGKHIVQDRCGGHRQSIT